MILATVKWQTSLKTWDKVRQVSGAPSTIASYAFNWKESMKMSQRIDSDTFKITMENYQWKALIGAQLSLKFQHLKIF